jgi:hypothetical protein
MSIPDLNENGLLPNGIHDASLEELRERFGRFQRTDRRPSLFAKLVEFMGAARSTGLVVAVLVNGSFVTAADEPSDIDLILVLRADHDYRVELKPFEYNALAKRRVRRRFGFDVLIAREGSDELKRYVDLFQQVKGMPDLRKGILEVRL